MAPARLPGLLDFQKSEAWVPQVVGRLCIDAIEWVYQSCAVAS